LGVQVSGNPIFTTVAQLYEKFQQKNDLKVTQGHQKWCYVMGHTSLSVTAL